MKQETKYLAENDEYHGYAAYLMGVVYNGKDAWYFEDRTSNKTFGIETASLEQIVKEAVQGNDTIQ